MVNALIFGLPSKPSSESIKLEVQHMQVFIEIVSELLRENN